jgi:1-acyl-sn-glycerol-3-phosphate acyltransferase
MANTKFYDRTKKIFGAFLKFVLRIHVHGSENEVSEGAIIVAANHISMVDPVALVVALRRRLRILGKKEVFKIPVLSWFIRSMGAYSVDRGHGDVAAVKKTISILNEGEAVCIFPQGKRYPGVDPSTTELKSGIGMIVARTKAGVQPIYIKTNKNKFMFFRRIDVIIGEKLEFDIPENIGDKPALYAEISHKIFDSICALGAGEADEQK